MVLKQHAATWLSLAIGLSLWASQAQCQTKAPSIRCDKESRKVCESIENMEYAFVLDGVSQANVDTYSSLDVVFTDGSSETTVSYDCKNDISSLQTVSKSLGSLTFDRATGQKSRTIAIKSAKLVNSSQDYLSLEVTEPSAITWTVYGTPDPDDNLPLDDPTRLSITNDASICGFKTELTTGSAWDDISEYSWRVANYSEFLIVGNGPTATLEQKRSEGGIYNTTVRTTTVYVKQTVGGTCSAEYKKDITLKGKPEVTLKMVDTRFGQGAVEICSSAASKEDRTVEFNCKITVSGETSDMNGNRNGILIRLSNDPTGKDMIKRTTAGEYYFPWKVDAAGDVTVAWAKDANGCISEGDSEYLHGTIYVDDRKPVVSLPTDSIYCEELSTSIWAEATNDMDDFHWGLASASKELKLNAGAWGDDTEGHLWSKMLGRADYYVVEVSPEYTELGLVACPSDTAFVSVYYDMPLRYPNAFSPNGDGKNDKLVIERLPQKNQLFVYDSRGKIVYEKADYRNDWDASNLEDGYYTYVLKGDGVKTIKETLAIKRTKTD